MNERAPSAYVSSVLLHGAAIALIILLAYVSSQSRPDTPQIMELVAGPGDNYMATEATKLGDANGITLNVPYAPVAPAPAETAPIVPAEPAPAAPIEARSEPVARPVSKPAKTHPKLPANPMLKTVTKAEIRTESAAKMHEARLRRAAAKAAAAEKARERAMSYDQFEKTAGGAVPKGKRGGVAAGASMADGAGGHALTAEMQDALGAWIAMLTQRWKDGFVPPADFNERMLAHVSFHVSASGTISNIHVNGSTGGAAFETAVADALRHVSMPPPPTKKGDDYTVDFSLRDQS